MKKFVLISSLTMMTMLAAAAEVKKSASSSAKSASATHSHAAAKTPTHSTSKTRAMQAGQGEKKGLTKQHTRPASSKSHKKGHKKFLLFGKRSS